MTYIYTINILCDYADTYSSKEKGGGWGGIVVDCNSITLHKR